MRALGELHLASGQRHVKSDPKNGLNCKIRGQALCLVARAIIIKYLKLNGSNNRNYYLRTWRLTSNIKMSTELAPSEP